MDTSCQPLVQKSYFQCFGLKETEQKTTAKPVLLNAEIFNWFAKCKSCSSTNAKQIPFAVVLELTKYTLGLLIFHV